MWVSCYVRIFFSLKTNYFLFVFISLFFLHFLFSFLCLSHPSFLYSICLYYFLHSIKLPLHSYSKPVNSVMVTPNDGSHISSSAGLPERPGVSAWNSGSSGIADFCIRVPGLWLFKSSQHTPAGCPGGSLWRENYTSSGEETWGKVRKTNVFFKV